MNLTGCGELSANLLQAQAYNVYCDESCHLEHDGQKTMGLGAVVCPTRYAPLVNHELKQLKLSHGMPCGYELKWTKVGAGKMDYYDAVLDLFFQLPYLRFRGLIVPDKGVIDHTKVPGQTHDDWYYKMYYEMLKPVVDARFDEHRIYIDIKDTHGYEKTQRLREVLCNSLHDFDQCRVSRVQEVRSDEVELLQLTDLLLGAIVYANRGVMASPGKASFVESFRERSGLPLTSTTAYRANKVNLLMWRGR